MFLICPVLSIVKFCFQSFAEAVPQTYILLPLTQTLLSRSYAILIPCVLDILPLDFSNILSVLNMSFRPLTYKKVSVNSQYRVSDSKSNSDCKIELQDTFEIPDNTTMQVHEVAIPNAWYSINTNNQNLYFRHHILPPATPQGITYRRIEIPVGNYAAPDLASAMETQLNTFFDNGGRTNSHPAIYDTLTNRITISSSYSEVVFIPLTDTDVPTFAGSFSNSVDLNNLNSMSNVLGFTTPLGDAFTSSSPWTTGFINLIN